MNFLAQKRPNFLHFYKKITLWFKQKYEQPYTLFIFQKNAHIAFVSFFLILSVGYFIYNIKYNLSFYLDLPNIQILPLYFLDGMDVGIKVTCVLTSLMFYYYLDESFFLFASMVMLSTFLVRYYLIINYGDIYYHGFFIYNGYVAGLFGLVFISYFLFDLFSLRILKLKKDRFVHRYFVTHSFITIISLLFLAFLYKTQASFIIDYIFKVFFILSRSFYLMVIFNLIKTHKTSAIMLFVYTLISMYLYFLFFLRLDPDSLYTVYYNYPVLIARFVQFFVIVIGGVIYVRKLKIERDYIMNESLENERQLAAAKLRAIESELLKLRSDMNPHFLFNCLNSIDIMLEIDHEKCHDMMETLSLLYRKNISLPRGKTVSLKDELALLNLYLKLEKIRFNDRFQYKIELRCIEIQEPIFLPPLVLQTLIENAIKHGVARLAKGGLVHVVLERQYDDWIYITITNPVSTNKNELITPEPIGTGTGLKNTRMRLHLLYGEKSQFAFHIVQSVALVSFRISGEEL